MDSQDHEMEPTTSTIVASENESNRRKRRLSQSNDPVQETKRFIPNPENGNDGVSKLLELSDEMLLKILQGCDSASLYALSKTCKHLLKLVKDRTLWKTFDFSTKQMMGIRIKQFMGTVPTTDVKEFKVRGFVSKYPHNKWKNNTITVHMLRKLATDCPNLETMELYNAYINFNKIKISDFPTTLQRLIISDCRIPTRSNRLFSKIDDYLPRLTEISLESCPWFETHDLVVFSKLLNLKRLILRGCSSLKGCVPYGSIATRFGFKKLEYLDVRDTPISDSDIQCFNITTTLREILMDCPQKSRESVSAPETNGVSTFYAHNDGITNGSSSHHEFNENGNTIDAKRTDDAGKDSDSECSSDSEDNDSDNEDAIEVKRAETREEHPHFIQVVLRNDRSSAVESNNNTPRVERLRCVIGIINGREMNRSSRAEDEVANTPNESAAVPVQGSSNTQERPTQSDNLSLPNQNSNVTEAGSSNNTTQNGIKCEENVPDHDQPGPSGLQSNQNNVNETVPVVNVENVQNDVAQQNESPNENSARNEATFRPQLIIVRQRECEPNEERRISWELHPLHQRADAILRQMHNTGNPNSNVGSSISDRGMCSFGIPQRNVQQNVVWIRAEARPAETLLERITIRHYRAVTDVTLHHLAICAPNLQYLDVTGTSVTKEGIETFLQSKPDCRVVSNFVE